MGRSTSFTFDGGQFHRPRISTYARLVHKPVLDGEKWIAERLKFLRQRLSEPLSAGQRRAIQDEIEALSKERGIMPGGSRFPRLLRLLRRRR